MKLFRLRSFVAVAESEKSVTAARRLGITPAAVSQHINDLEDELNVALFQRRPSGMQLTPKGRLLVQHAKDTLESIHVLEKKAATLGDEVAGPITLGICASPSLLRLSVLASKLQQDHPHISLQPRQMYTSGIVSGLLNHEIDVGFVLADTLPRRLILVPICRCEAAVVVPRSWRSFRNQSERSLWETLARKPWIHAGPDCKLQQLADQQFDASGTAYTSTIQAPDLSVREELVSAGFGASIMFREDAEKTDGVDIVHIITDPCPLGLAYPRSRADDPYIRRLQEVVLDVWPGLEVPSG